MTTQFEQEIKKIVDSMQLYINGIRNMNGYSYIFSTYNEANTAFEEEISFPIVLNLLPTGGQGTVAANTIKLAPHCLVAFIDKLPTEERTSADITLIVNEMIKAAMKFISKVNESSYFENVLTFRWTSIGLFDVKTAGIVLEIQLKEKIGTQFCKINQL